MIVINNPAAFAESIADVLKQIDANRSINTFEKIRLVNAVAKATVRIEQSGSSMQWQPEKDSLLIWSSNETYHASTSCQCLAHLNGKTCWHKAAYNLIRNYVLACDRQELDQLNHGQTSTLPLHETATTFNPGSGVRA